MSSVSYTHLDVYKRQELQRHPELEVGFVTATPRMARYLEYSTQIYNICLLYTSPRCGSNGMKSYSLPSGVAIPVERGPDMPEESLPPPWTVSA